MQLESNEELWLESRELRTTTIISHAVRRKAEDHTTTTMDSRMTHIGP